MQFQVPQFIEVEDKVIGPLTFKQFLYVGGGAGISFILWRLLPLWLAALPIMGILGITAALAMGQWNGRPFVTGLENGFYYLLSKKLYLWSQERRLKKPKNEVAEKVLGKQEVYIPKLADSKLHELAWSLDIKERIENARFRDVPTQASENVAAAPDEDLALRVARASRIR